MSTPKRRFDWLLVAAAFVALPAISQAGTFHFTEYDGVYADNDPLPFDLLPDGVPDGVTASWTGFAVHSNAGDDPMSVFPAGAEASIGFSLPVTVQSINSLDTETGDPAIVIGKLRGLEVWRYTSPGDHDWQRITAGAGKDVDRVVFVGTGNFYDNIEVEAALDSDFDTYSDGEEMPLGHDPFNYDDNPAAVAIADSQVQFGGIQGDFDWFYGYRNVSTDGGGPIYDPATGFIAFSEEMWNGGGWDVDPGAAAPWTVLGRTDLHPNAGTGDTHWPIRRWVANQITATTPLAIRWHTHHANTACGGDGITGAVYRNGQVLDSERVAARDNVGVTHTVYVNAEPGDRFDLILSAKGTGATESDGCDGSVNWLIVNQTIPEDPLQPDGSIFVPVGTGDTDNDNIPDVWEKSFFPNDLTKLTASGDFDQDGLTDVGEYQRLSDPTKADTDGDTLGDLVESNTGVFVSKTNTGTSPTKTDSDGDGLADNVEVNGTPATNPNKADSDGDSWSDSDELDWGTDPNNAEDDPTTSVIANSEDEFSGVQGQNGWFSGYRIFDHTVGATNYNASADFIPFPGGDGQGDWDGFNQTWTGDIWKLNTAAAGPWTELGPLITHPNGTNNPGTIDGIADPTNEHWTIRRWTASELTKETPATIVWTVKKTNLSGTGVTGLLFLNGNLVDSKAIEGNDGTGEIRRYSVTLKPTDIVDLAISPVGPSGEAHDGSDGSHSWMWVDARAGAAPTPTLSVTRTATGLTLTFNGSLESADKVEGPYTNVTATGTFDVLFSSGPAKFYRARSN